MQNKMQSHDWDMKAQRQSHAQGKCPQGKIKELEIVQVSSRVTIKIISQERSHIAKHS